MCVSSCPLKEEGVESEQRRRLVVERPREKPWEGPTGVVSADWSGTKGKTGPPRRDRTERQNFRQTENPNDSNLGFERRRLAGVEAGFRCRVERDQRYC